MLSHDKKTFTSVYNGGPTYRDLVASDPLRWPSLQVALREWAPYEEPYETELDLRVFISIIVDAPFTMDHFHNGVWRSVRWIKGMGLVVPPREKVRLRRDRNGNKSITAVQMLLPETTIQRVADELPQGRPNSARALKVSISDDPTLEGVGTSLLRAYEAGAPDFYAQTAATWLAAQLLLGVKKVPTWHQSLSGERISDRRVRRVLEYVEAHVSDRLDLEVLAREAGISHFHFLALFNKAVGTTPQRYIQQFRMQIAKTMLLSTEKRVLDIAFSIGYRSAAHFGAMFRRDCGETPTEFRARRKTR